jgi:vacuolar-type H+-ATPase subunit I/STV1
MPTGYTAELMEKGLPFRKFALQCARAFGACIMQRDDPMTDEPKRQEPSDFYTKRVAEAEKKLKQLQAMPTKRQQDYGEEQRAKALASAKQMLASERRENERLDGMAAQVRAWQPPTDEHKGLKDFMLEQIKISRHDLAWAENYVREAEEKTVEAYFVEAVSKAVRDVAYYKEEMAKEQARNNQRNDWIDALYRSLPR